LEDAAADGLLLAIRSNWPWETPDQWRHAWLLLRDQGLGWYTIVAVDTLYELPDL